MQKLGANLYEMMFALSEESFEFFNAGSFWAHRNVNRRREDQILSKQLEDKKAALAEMEQTFAGIVQTGAGEWSIALLCDWLNSTTTWQLPRQLAHANLPAKREAKRLPIGNAELLQHLRRKR